MCHVNMSGCCSVILGFLKLLNLKVKAELHFYSKNTKSYSLTTVLVIRSFHDECLCLSKHQGPVQMFICLHDIFHINLLICLCLAVI